MNINTSGLYQQGVSIWLDNITRRMLDDGTLEHYINELGITGLTSNPSIFEAAITKTTDYDKSIKALGSESPTDEDVFFKLAVDDIRRAADLFLPVYRQTNGLDGFVSIEVSPLLAYDTESTIQAARAIHHMVDRPNAFIKIPGTPEGLPAIEQTIAEGIPINVTLLFSPEQYLAAAMAWMKGVEKRIAEGLNPNVRSVASVFVSRWDKALVAPYTVNTIPENTLLAFADHGETGKPLTGDVAEANKIMQQTESHGVNYLQLANQLQQEGAEAFNRSWENLIHSIATKRSQI